MDHIITPIEDIVYNYLGIDFGNTDYLDETIDIKQMAITFHSQNYENQYVAFNHGDYFQWTKKNDDNSVKDNLPKERMILNTSNQKESYELALFLASQENELIDSIKFYAMSKENFSNNPLIKCDKIVIYYKKKHRQAILNVISNYVKSTHIILKNNLSAFYDIFCDISTNAYVGIADEADASYSFTEFNRDCVLEAINAKCITPTDVFNYWCKKHGEKVIIK